MIKRFIWKYWEDILIIIWWILQYGIQKYWINSLLINGYCLKEWGLKKWQMISLFLYQLFLPLFHYYKENLKINIFVKKLRNIKIYLKFIRKETLMNLWIWEYQKRKYFLLWRLKLKVLLKQIIKDAQNVKEKYNKNVIIVISIIKWHTVMEKLLFKINWLLSKLLFSIKKYVSCSNLLKKTV